MKNLHLHTEQPQRELKSRGGTGMQLKEDIIFE